MQLRQPSHPSRGIPTAISCLATLLKEPVVRSSFVQADGVKLLVPLITPASTQQSMQVTSHLLHIYGAMSLLLGNLTPQSSEVGYSTLLGNSTYWE